MPDLDHLTALIDQALDQYQTPADIAGFLAAHGVAVVAPTTDRVNINTASLADLMGLPDIGRTLAGRILARREWHGPFASVNDLVLVPGFGRARLERIKDKICT